MMLLKLNVLFHILLLFHHPFGTLSKLQFLHLGSSFFQGEIPSEISLLSKLTHLDLSYNVGGNGPVLVSLLKINPNVRSLFQNLTALDSLFLTSVHITYELSESLTNLTSLTHLGLGSCGLYGPLPPSLGKLTQLNWLNLKENEFTGYIPSSFQNLTKLSFIKIAGNQISGPIPSWFGNISELTFMGFFSNSLSGTVPPSLSKLSNLETLDLGENILSGTLQLDSFLKLRNLTELYLGFNMISLLIDETKIDPNTTLSKFYSLAFANCNLSKFPEFIGHQTNLVLLDLSYNNIVGQIPQTLMSIQTLEAIYLSNNWITGFHNHTIKLPWSSLRMLEMQDNSLQGQLPIPPSSIKHYDVSNNNLSGEIPMSICNLTSIAVLDLSSNNFSGEFPPCLGSMINNDSLIALNLRNNSFHGTIPLECQQESELRMVDFSHNHFQGKLRRPISTCVNLEYLDFSFNQISDVFPTWLGSFPLLKVVLLRANKFHGVIRKPQSTTTEFPRLQIIDVSHNYFTGALPHEYMLIWNAMKAFKLSNLTYMKAWENDTFSFSYELKLNFLQKFDVSYNNLTGLIPRGNQFQTFENSFEGNQGLCGEPLLKKCENMMLPPPSALNKNVDSDSPIEIDWNFVLAGLVSGFVIGVSLGEIVIPRTRLAWLIYFSRTRLREMMIRG
ncbi:hypothetical protein CsatB_019207 [Cannabis sativa]